MAAFKRTTFKLQMSNNPFMPQFFSAISMAGHSTLNSEAWNAFHASVFFSPYAFSTVLHPVVIERGTLRENDVKSYKGSVHNTLHQVGGFLFKENGFLFLLNGFEHNADGNYAYSGYWLMWHVQLENWQRSGRVNAALMQVPIGACERDNRRATYRTIFSQARWTFTSSMRA